MEEFRDATKLAESLRSKIDPSAGALIGVDGAYGSGKSTLAEGVARQLGAIHVKVDQYTENNGKPYLQQLRYDDLRRALDEARAQKKPVIVDGVCLLGVLEQLGMSPNALVYVMKMDESGYWPDKNTCDPERIDLTSPLLQPAGAALARDVAMYHQKHDPASKADHVFVRVE